MKWRNTGRHIETEYEYWPDKLLLIVELYYRQLSTTGQLQVFTVNGVEMR